MLYTAATILMLYTATGHFGICKVFCFKQSVSRSKHKMVHTQLRANLSATKLDDQLFIRYNFENIINISNICNDPLFFDFGPFEDEN